jgi:hypothetical protein
MQESDRLPSGGRRRFLSSTALGGLGLLAGVRAAWAFTEQPMNAATHKLYADRCRLADDGYHAQLAAAERTRFGTTLSAAQRDAALAALRCPICGCPLIAAAAAPAPKAG